MIKRKKSKEIKVRHYLVVIQDEWNNLYYIGDYKHLNDSIKDINEHIEPVCENRFKLKKGMLKEYPSTFGECFDTDLSEYDDSLCGFMIRGFILYD